MERQKTLPQMIEHKNSPEKELNKVEASNLPDIKVKIMVLMMLKKVGENLNSMKKDIETMKKEPFINKEHNI